MAEYSVLSAVATGKADLVAAAVAKGCTVNETDQEGNSCLHIAAAKGSNEILRILLNAGAKVSAKNECCKTALDVATNDEVKAALRQHGARHSLFYAVEQGMLELVVDLIKEGADINERDKAGNTAVERAQNAQTIDLLKGAGATMPEFPEEKKNNLLIEYAKKGATGGALMAIQAGADVNHKGAGGYTLLHYTARDNKPEVAKVLLANGADINAKDYSGFTPIHHTARDNKPEVAKVLLANGAQVNVGDNGGRTALRVAREFDSFGRWSPLVGNPEMEALLRQHGAEIEVMPPTIRSENTSARRAMEFDSFGRWAPLVGNPEMEALLRQHGAEIEVMPPTIRSENTSARRAMHCTFVQIANAAGGLGSAMMNFFTLIISLLPNLGVRIVNIFALATDVLIAICILLVRGFGDFLVIGILFPNSSAVVKEF
jgi:ankyrin repeat protein